ncbi:hypothetical protein D3C84_523410 [compost metagenome]
MRSAAWPGSTGCSPCIARPAPGARAWPCARTTRTSSSTGSRSGTTAGAATASTCCPRSGWPMPGCSATWGSTTRPGESAPTSRNRRRRNPTTACCSTCCCSRPASPRIAARATRPSAASNRRCNLPAAMALANCCSTRARINWSPCANCCCRRPASTWAWSSRHRRATGSTRCSAGSWRARNRPAARSSSRCPGANWTCCSAWRGGRPTSRSPTRCSSASAR